MARVSDYQLREFVENLGLEASELCELLELSVQDIASKFPSRIRQQRAKLGFDDFIPTGEEDDTLQSFD